MTDTRTFAQVVKGMSISDVIKEKAKHTPWWKKSKYKYHTSDAVTGVKIRPGMKLAQMNCNHMNESITMETYGELKKRTPKGQQVLCPLCRTPIPDQ
jgi:uncharacterized protein YwlG (UPF0340 family)